MVPPFQPPESDFPRAVFWYKQAGKGEVLLALSDDTLGGYCPPIPMRCQLLAQNRYFTH